MTLSSPTSADRNRHRLEPSRPLIRGWVVDRSTAPRAWDMIDRNARRYTGQPDPLRIDRIVLLIEADHAQAVTLG